MLARKGQSQRGFTLIETVIAIGTIFLSLTALAFTATSGFRYIALSRERQAANQIADRLMEETRGLAFDKIAQGMDLAEVTTSDPHICLAGDGTFRFIQDKATGTCTGEKIVATGDLQPVFPLVPHVSPGANSEGAFGTAQGYPVDYSWQTYVTQCQAKTDGGPATECSSTNGDLTPYRVTVIVSWSGGGIEGAARSVRSQSLFSEASGCGASDATHPFAAPCQAYISGRAGAGQGTITITSATQGQEGVLGTGFQSGDLLMPTGESDIQVEQVARIAGRIDPSGVALSYVDPVLGTVETASRGQGASTLADGDPSGGAPPYSTTGAYTAPVGSPPPPLSTPDLVTGSDLDPSVTLSYGPGDQGESDSAAFAGQTVALASGNVVSACPPSPMAGESDGEPCGGSTTRQADQLQAFAVLNFAATSLLGSIPAPNLGRTALASVDAVGTTDPTTTLTDQDGASIGEAVSRTIGAVRLGGIPQATTPADPDEAGAWQGSFVTLTGYGDQAEAFAGAGSTAPSASVQSGTIQYWNGSGYAAVVFCSATSDWREGSCSGTPVTQFTMDQTLVVATGDGLTTAVVSINGTAQVALPSTSGSNAEAAGAPELTQGQVSPPLFGSFTYQVSLCSDPSCVATTPLANLKITADLGTITAAAGYTPPPAGA